MHWTPGVNREETKTRDGNIKKQKRGAGALQIVSALAYSSVQNRESQRTVPGICYKKKTGARFLFFLKFH